MQNRTMPNADLSIWIERAIAWAMARVGSHDYAYKCLAFVEDAYEAPNGLVLDGYSDAKQAADGYGVTVGRSPPQGAFVFYDCVGTLMGERRNWGHVGLCIGKGAVVHAWGRVRIDSHEAVENLSPGPEFSSPVYVGWARAETVLKGVRRADGA